MNIRILNLFGVTCEKDFHDLIVEVFEFPDHYGRNLDAFWDCITEIFEVTHVKVFCLESLPVNVRLEVNRYICLLQEYANERQERFSVELVN